MSDEIWINSIDPKVVETGTYKMLAYEGSEWQCLMFGGTPDNGLKWRPPKGGEPNWFWRKMQYLILGNEWVKDRKLTNAELYDHYDFYIDNCTGNEIPLSFKEWKREHEADLIELFNND